MNVDNPCFAFLEDLTPLADFDNIIMCVIEHNTPQCPIAMHTNPHPCFCASLLGHCTASKSGSAKRAPVGIEEGRQMLENKFEDCCWTGDTSHCEAYNSSGVNAREGSCS